jgi:hypothetical protein
MQLSDASTAAPSDEGVGAAALKESGSGDVRRMSSAPA